jgi:flagellar biosynthesis protein FliQ
MMCSECTTRFWNFSDFFVDDSHPALVVGTLVCGVYVGLDPAHVALNDGALVFDPKALGILVVIYVA